jgi:hypothetical protein
MENWIEERKERAKSRNMEKGALWFPLTMENGSINYLGRGNDHICLAGVFTIEQLQALISHMKNNS